MDDFRGSSQYFRGDFNDLRLLVLCHYDIKPADNNLCLCRSLPWQAEKQN